MSSTMAGADPGFFLGGGALISCSTSTPINQIVFFLQNTSSIRKPQVISGGGVPTPCTLPLDPPLNGCHLGRHLRFLPRLRNQVKTMRNGDFLCLTRK